MTLLEIMIVLAILALVMGLVVGPRVMKMFGESKVDIAARAPSKELRVRGVPVVVASHPDKACPDKLEDLNEYMNSKDIKDPWGNPYKMFCGPSLPAGVKGGIAVMSGGPRRQRGHRRRHQVLGEAHGLAHHDRKPRGMTVLELMIVLAIIGGAAFLVRSGFRMVTKADLVENSTELTAMMRRASQLAIEHGELHRVVIDLDKGIYVVEVCQGQTAIMRNEQLRVDEQAKKRALEQRQESC